MLSSEFIVAVIDLDICRCLRNCWKASFWAITIDSSRSGHLLAVGWMGSNKDLCLVLKLIILVAYFFNFLLSYIGDQVPKGGKRGLTGSPASELSAISGKYFFSITYLG